MIRVYIITCLNQIQPTQVARNRLTVNETSSAALAQSWFICFGRPSLRSTWLALVVHLSALRQGGLKID